ncbi:MAG: helix-turn-helix transcriptional regulator [Zoogloeaceae bacterium]|nr:helix-turn-helix transcriptional regulator [Zoogloeaceae bacterium]
MSNPTPGAKVRGSISGAPINALFDLLGRRWALGILWYLGEGPCVFRQLQERCGGMSPSILNARLKELRDANIVARTIDGYALTDRGMELRSFVVPLANWSASWSQEVYGYERPGMKERLANELSARKSPAT